MAKRNYSGKLRNKLSSSDSASVRKGMKDITNYKTPPPRTLAGDFNGFYCRFGKTPHTRPEHLSTQSLPPPATSLSPTPALEISEDDMPRSSERIKEWKHQDQTMGHQSALKPVLTSWPHLHTDFQQKYFSSYFKCSTITPSQRNPKLLYLMTTDLLF